MKASFLPTTTYGIRAVYEAGWPTPPSLFEPELEQRMAAFAASQGHGLALSFAPLSYIAQVIPHYREEAAKHGWEPQEDQILFRGNLVATDTDEEAQQLAGQLATLPHLKRPQGPPAASAPSDGGERKASPVAPVLIGEASSAVVHISSCHR